MSQYHTFPKNNKVDFLLFGGGTVVEELCMFERGIYFFVFYCLCYVKDISANMLEKQVLEERYLDLNEEEDIILYAIRKEHCRDVAEESGDKKKIHELRWEVYFK